MRRWIRASSLSVAALTAACGHPPHTQLNAPPQGGVPRQRPAFVHYYVNHNDQGLMSDLSIADIHFIPHTAELSGNGEVRLIRYAELLATSGGLILYDTALTDQTLIKARLAAANAFLAEAVPGANPIVVAVGLPGGPGMIAKEAVAGKDVALQPEPRNTAYKLNTGKSSTTSR